MTSEQKVGQMLRLLIFLVGMLSTNRPRAAALRPGESYRRPAAPDPDADDPDDGDPWYLPPQSQPPRRPFREPGPVRLNVHLPHVRLSWPWQSVSAGTTTDTDIGPWVLQKIEGISRPALGQENFNFTFTHKVSKNIGFWPCWYSSTFAAVGHASATVDLNPGPSWWTPASGHYRLQVLSRPAAGTPGRVSVTIVLPRPQLPQSVHDVTVDNTLSHPIDVQHSWTYPGLGCGAL